MRRIAEKNPEIMQEVRNGSVVSKFSGRGQQDTTLITFKGVLKLVMHLPGVNARAMRDKFADILQRYFGGDPTLVAELGANYAREDPVSSLARESAGVPEPEAGESRENAFDTTVNKVLEDTRLRNAITNITKEEMALIKSEFDRQRKRKLYDNQVEEKRLENEHKRRILEIQIDRDSKVSYEEAKQKTFRSEVDCLKEILELKKEMKALETAQDPAPAEYVEPKFEGIVTVSRVADYVLPIDTLADDFRAKVLLRAGRMASRTLPAERNKIHGLFGYMENWYNHKWFDKMEAILKQAYAEERALLNAKT